MGIFKQRPLAALLFVLLCGFAFFAACTQGLQIVLCVALCLCGILAHVLFRKNKHLPFLRALLITCAISFLLSFLYFGVWFAADERFADADGIVVRGTVTEVTYTDGYYTIATLQASSINNEPLSAYKLALTDEEGLLGRVAVGDTCTLFVELLDGEAELGEESRLGRIGQGISASVRVTKVVEYTKGGNALLSYLAGLRASLIDRAVSVSDTASGGLLVALLIGDRTLLQPTLLLDFTRIGVTHMLALSGMHLSLLCIAISFLFSLLGIHKRARIALMCPLVIAYVLLAGAPSSLLRAAFMLLLSSLLFLSKRTHDSITTLSISIVLICLFEPYAIYDIGLWLSALSTFGLLATLTHKRAEIPSIPKRLLHATLQSLLLSFGAIAASLLISVIVFQALSPLSPISTLLFGILIQIYMYVGILTLLFGQLLPIGQALMLLKDGIAFLAHTLSGGRYVYLDASFSAVRMLVVLFTVALLVFLVFSIKHKRIALGTIGTLFIGVFVCAFVLTAAAREQTALVYYKENRNEGFVMVSDGQASVIDIGTGGAAFGLQTRTVLSNHHILSLDKYILTRYSVFLPQAVESVLTSMRCEAIYIPSPKTEEEYAIYERLLRLADTHACDTVLYTQDMSLSCGELSMLTEYRQVEDTRTQLWLTLCYGNERHLYLSRGSVNDKTKTAATELISQSDTILYGCCGYASDYVLDIPLFDENERIVFSDRQIDILRDTYEEYRAGAEIFLSPEELYIIR